jgi:hypothetical protein
MRDCPRCGGGVDDVFRYCPWCGDRRRTKLVEFFRSHPSLDEGRALRVSRYLGGRHQDRHVRFSVWAESEESARAEAAVSLPESEASRLALFLLDPAPRARPRGLREALRAVKERAARPA